MPEYDEQKKVRQEEEEIANLIGIGACMEVAGLESMVECDPPAVDGNLL